MRIARLAAALIATLTIVSPPSRALAASRLTLTPPPGLTPSPAPTPSPPQSPLPRTGEDVLSVALAGLGSIAAGAALRGRRRPGRR
jgi:LPXTG-motif cell wall-anchored protein